MPPPQALPSPSSSLMRLSAPLYRLTEFLVARLGEFPAFLLVSFALPRLLRAAATRFFIAADARGWLEKYRIQPGRRVAAADVQNLWAAKYGAGSWRGLLLYALPLETLNFVMQKRRGLSLSGGTETWAELARSLAVAAFVWDTFVWAAHVALHHPLLYKRFHKQHHEFQAPMILVSEHFHPLDNLLEATLGAYIGNCVGRTSWFAMNIFGWWRLWTVIHNHCGFRVPWDIFNWMFGYIEYHDFHHQNFRGNYQTYFRFWDSIFGWDREFVEFQRKQAERKATEDESRSTETENARVDSENREFWGGGFFDGGQA